MIGQTISLGVRGTHVEYSSLEPTLPGVYDGYGQLLTKFVTLGLPNPVAKSQPFCAEYATSSVVSDTESTPNRVGSGRKQLFVPKHGTSILPNVTSWKMQVLPTFVPIVSIAFRQDGRFGIVSASELGGSQIVIDHSWITLRPARLLVNERLDTGELWCGERSSACAVVERVQGY